MTNCSKFAGTNQCGRVLHRGEPPVVEADAGSDPGLACRFRQRPGVRCGPADRLLAVDVLLGCDCSEPDFPMERRRRADVDNVNRRVGHDVPPFRSGPGDLPTPGEGLRDRHVDVDNGNDFHRDTQQA